MAGLGTLGKLDLDHLHLIAGCLVAKLLRVEPTILCPAAEIPGPQFPDQIATPCLMVAGYAALARVVEKTALRRPPVQRLNGCAAERAETHGRDVQNTGRIGFCPVSPHLDPERVPGRVSRTD